MKFTSTTIQSCDKTPRFKAVRRSLKQAVFSAMALSLCATSASALDTDIYFDRAVEHLPNIVFYMDTSGSMRGSMNNVPLPYDPLTTYTGSFASTEVYYAPSGRVPSTPSAVNSGQRGYMHCDVANTGIDARGFFTGRLTARLPNAVPDNATAEDVWLPINRGTWKSTDGHMVDCYEDRGTHGQNGGGGATYLSTDTASAWTANTGDEIDWTDTGYTTAYVGNYINYKLNPPIEPQTGTRTNKAEAMKRVLINVMHLFPQINAGLARMNGGSGATILLPVTDHRDVSARSVFETAVNALPASGTTPLAEGLYEIYSYYRGANRYFGSSSTTHPSAISGSTYISPISHECERNHVMMFTDGVPYSDSTQWPIESLPNFSTVTGVTGGCHSGNNRETDNSCLDELALYMSEEDASTAFPNVLDDNNDGVPDGQTVKVHPVGVQIGFDLLEDTATAAGTNYFSAQDALQLENNLVDLLSNITGNSSVASRLVTSSDQFGRISHRNEIYTALYEPTSNFQWKGNIKKYRIAYDGVRPYLTDSDEVNNPEIMTSGGSILGSAQSYWSATPDGNDILEGGVRERLKLQNPANRNIYGINNLTESNLSNAEHAVNLGVAPVNTAMGATDRSAAERQDILDFSLGHDVKDEDANASTISRGHIGGMAHNEPLVIQYGGTPANPDVVVFAATSDGLLHGFDGETGDEIFAVAPLAAVENFVEQFDNPITGTVRDWGIDGKLAAYVIDKNRDGIINKSAGDRAYLWMSYGLGGRALYVLDVTEANDRANPIIEVESLKDFDGGVNRWSELGHSLAKPLPIRVRQGTSGLTLMAMSYGYDPAAEFSYTGHTMGRGLSLLRVSDGYNQWSATSNTSSAVRDLSFADMDFAFAAEPSPVDTNGDGFIDRLYAVDLGAQVWRFDIADNFVNRSSGSLNGGRIAELGADTDGNRRRVFKPIRTALVQDDASTWVALAVGTGDRMNPLTSDNDNRLYLLKDYGITNSPTSFVTLDNSDLYDATSNALGTLTDQTQLQNEYEDLRTAKGWYIDLPSNRKAISTPLISDGIVNFPVYTIPSGSNPCERDIGQGTIYRMSLFDAKPIFDYNGNTTLDTDDREVELFTPGIPADLVGHRDEEGRLSVCAGLECFPADPNRTVTDANPPAVDNYWFRKND